LNFSVGPQCRLEDGTVSRVRCEDSETQRYQLHYDQQLVHQAQEEQLIQQSKEQLVHTTEEQEEEEVARYYDGGPYDLTLLTRYHDHIAHKLWFGQVNNYFNYLIVLFNYIRSFY